jgi:thioredoxin reductase
VFDTLIVGGGPAGLSTALVLGRARRSVLLIDSGRPANGAARAVGGLLGQTGVAPTELRSAGRAQLEELPTVEVRNGEALAAELGRAGLTVRLDTGELVHTRSLVLAHGLRYEPPPLPGIEPLWARSAFHCPFCDGWEVRDRPLAVHGRGREAARSALVVAGWSNDVVLCTDGPAAVGPERAVLAAAGVRVREERIRRLVGDGDQLRRIEFEAGPDEHRDALFVRTHRDQPNGLAAGLGCELTDGGTIVTDGDGRTGIPGVFAAGDAATERLRSVANAMGAGSRVAYSVALDLVTELGQPAHAAPVLSLAA